MKEQIAIQKLLQRKFTENQARNSAYSINAFARKLSMSSGALCEILNGNRNVSAKLAARIAERLLLDPQERSELLGAFPKKMKRRKQGDQTHLDSVEPNYLQLNSDQFHVIADWCHYAILSLLKLSQFQSDPEWISIRLGISLQETKRAIERLKRLELIEENEIGVLKRIPLPVRTSDDILNISVQRAHLQELDLARKSLENDSVERRDVTSMTLAINPSKLPQAKEAIRRFQDELAALLEEAPQSEVYKFCMQLFPLTHEAGGENKSKTEKSLERRK